MKTINKPIDNLGGLLKIWAIPKSDFYIAGNIVTFPSPQNIYEIYCPPDSMSFSEQKQKSTSGIHYNTEVNGFIVGDTQNNQEAVNYMEPKKWVVIFRDGNGNYKLAGLAGNPLVFTANLTTGNQTAQRAGYSFKFTGNTLARSIFINNPF